MSAILTVRLIRSFEHRNIQHLVLTDVHLDQNVLTFRKTLDAEIQNKGGLPPPFRKFAYDTLKISHKAYGTKSGDLVISTEDDDKLVLRDSQTLAEAGVENETELSYFKVEDYRKYQNSRLISS
ncbi:hypothetical protein ScPMuIL_009612 [Solemya velum]